MKEHTRTLVQGSDELVKAALGVFSELWLIINVRAACASSI